MLTGPFSTPRLRCSNENHRVATGFPLSIVGTSVCHRGGSKIVFAVTAHSIPAHTKGVDPVATQLTYQTTDPAKERQERREAYRRGRHGSTTQSTPMVRVLQILDEMLLTPPPLTTTSLKGKRVENKHTHNHMRVVCKRCIVSSPIRRSVFIIDQNYNEGGCAIVAIK